MNKRYGGAKLEKSKAIQKHLEWKGKIEVIARAEIENKDDLAIAYTPGVAEPLPGDSKGRVAGL